MNQPKPIIQLLEEKKLLGMRMRMSISNNKTAELWSSFIPLRKSILNRVSEEMISMQIYDGAYFRAFNPNNEFEKWACVEVSDLNKIPENLELFTLIGGLYAVFNYKGSSADKRIFQYIYSTWLPGSEYLLDSRPHFEVLGEKYKNNDLNSEEEIWIPVREK